MLNKYLDENYNKIKDMAHNIAGENGRDDLLHFIIEELYKCDHDKLKEIINKNQMTFYIARVMVNQYYSKTSRYYYKYKKYYELHATRINEQISKSFNDPSKEEFDKKQKLAWIKEKLKECHWFDAQLFEIYYKGRHTLDSLSKATKINRNTIYHSLKKVKKFLIHEKN
tara:strand:+ start:574 stop:1080 length:507 start_codon:yes stop_codon:yes gene_type:complete